jgi:DNA-binding NarL/FixJ family response regulator
LGISWPDFISARTISGWVATFWPTTKEGGERLVLGEVLEQRCRLAGLKAGVDDYLLKPFTVPELLARLRALRRRAALSPRAQGDVPVGGLLGTASLCISPRLVGRR